MKTSKRKNLKHSLEEKLAAINLYKSGNGSAIIGKRLFVNEWLVRNRSESIKPKVNQDCTSVRTRKYSSISKQKS